MSFGMYDISFAIFFIGAANQRLHRAGQMVGITPSTNNDENSVGDFVEGLAAPIKNIAKDISYIPKDIESLAKKADYQIMNMKIM